MEDCCRMGMRIPLVKTRVGTNDSLHIAHGVNFYGNYFGDISGIPTNEWFHLGLAQFKSKVAKYPIVNHLSFQQFVKYQGNHYFEIKLNKERVALWQNSMARTFKNIKVFAGDNYYIPAQAKIKNLVVIPSKSAIKKEGPVTPRKVMLKCSV